MDTPGISVLIGAYCVDFQQRYGGLANTSLICSDTVIMLTMNPETDFDRSTVTIFIDDTESVIEAFENVDVIDRRAFAVFVLLRNRR